MNTSVTGQLIEKEIDFQLQMLNLTMLESEIKSFLCRKIFFIVRIHSKYFLGISLNLINKIMFWEIYWKRFIKVEDILKNAPNPDPRITNGHNQRSLCTLTSTRLDLNLLSHWVTIILPIYVFLQWKIWTILAITITEYYYHLLHHLIFSTSTTTRYVCILNEKEEKVSQIAENTFADRFEDITKMNINPNKTGLFEGSFF